MKLWKSSMLIIGVAVLILSSITVSAVTETDPPGDVFHATWANGLWGYTTVTSGKSNIDITAISADVNDGELTLSLTVAGNIETSTNFAYVVTYNTSDAMYWMVYGGYLEEQNGFSWGMQTTGGFNFSSGNVTLEGTNTIRSTLDLIGESDRVDLWGMATEYTGDPQTNPYAEQWVDVAGDMPDFETGGGNGDGDGNGGGDGNGDGDGGGTPGFEALALIAAVAIALIVLRRRK